MRKQAQGNQGTFPRSHIEWFYLEGTILKEKKELKENKWACDFKWGLFNFFLNYPAKYWAFGLDVGENLRIPKE